MTCRSKLWSTPEILGNLQLIEWNDLLPEAWSAGLLARLGVLLNEHGCSKTLQIE